MVAQQVTLKDDKVNTNEKDNIMSKSKGIGDTVEKIMKATGVKAAVKTVTKAIGVEDCGCDQRKDTLNRIFPYDKK